MFTCIYIVLLLIGTILVITLPTVFHHKTLNKNSDNLDNSTNIENNQLMNQATNITFNDSYIITRLKKLLESFKIENVVIWGHPLHSHTHSYVHDAFYKAFRYIGIKTSWVPALCYYENEEKRVYTGSLKNTLFLTEGQVCRDMPQSSESFYMLHNVDGSKISDIPTQNIINFQFAITDTLNTNIPVFDNFQAISPDLDNVHITWGTNLLPHEFKNIVDTSKNENNVTIIGQQGSIYESRINRFMTHLNNFELQHRAAIEHNEMLRMIRSAKCAPALINESQLIFGYIPCRLFKNISYGQIPITSSKMGDYVLHHNTVFNENEEVLGTMFKNNIDSENLLKKQINAYKLTQSRHTYLNIIELLLFSLSLKRNHNTYEKYFSPKVSKSINVLHISCHTGLERYFDYVSHKLQYKIDHLNMSKFGSTIYNMTENQANEMWEKHKTKICNYTNVIVSDTAPLSRIIIQHMDEFKGKIIIYICNRFNYADTASEDKNDPFPDDKWSKLLEHASVHYGSRVKVINYTKLERIFAMKNNVMWNGPFADSVLRPIGNLVNSNVNKSAFSDDIITNKSKYVLIPPYLNDEIIPISYLTQKGIQNVRGRYHGPDDVMGFKAVVHIPYAPNNLFFGEMMVRGIPMYLPSKKFMKDILQETQWFSGGVEHFECSEWYDTFNEKLFVYFDSWDDLIHKLKNNEHKGKSDICKKWGLSEAHKNLCRWNIMLHN